MIGTNCAQTVILKTQINGSYYCHNDRHCYIENVIIQDFMFQPRILKISILGASSASFRLKSCETMFHDYVSISYDDQRVSEVVHALFPFQWLKR